MLPQDPVILLSVVNARLRDLYPDLDELCHSENADRAQLEEKLAAIDSSQEFVETVWGVGYKLG